MDLGYEPAEPPDVLFHGTVARLLPSIRDKRCIGAGYPRDLEVGRDGWWLVLQHEKLEGQVVALDPDGEVRAVRPLGPHFHWTLDTDGTFPLLLYTDADFPDGTAASRFPAVAERLKSDGSARWQVALPFDNLAVRGFSSLAVRGGYLVATPGFYTATLVHVSENGELTVADDRLRDVIGARLFDDDGPIAVYTKLETPERAWVRRLDAYGRPQSEPVEIARSDAFSTSLVRSGRLLDVHGAIVDGRDVLEVRWFDLATGDLQSPAWRIAEIPRPYPSGTHHIGVTVADLSDPVVFWTRGDLVEGLMAARIRG